MITKDEVDAVIDGIAPVVREYVAEEINKVPAPQQGPKGDQGDQGPGPDPALVQIEVEKAFQSFASEFVEVLNAD